MKTPFLGSAYSSRSKDLADQRAINIYPEIVETKDGNEVGGFYGCPGLDLLTMVGAGPHRGYLILKGVAYVVSGNQLYSVSVANNVYTVTALGTALATAQGAVGMIANPTQVLVVDGVQGYVWDTVTLAFTANVFAALAIIPTVCSYQDGFGIVNNVNTNQFYQSNLNTFLTWDPLKFSSADSDSDPIISMIDVQRELWLFKIKATEIWRNAGLSGFVFKRLDGVIPRQGCVAAASVALLGDEIVWLGQDDQGSGIVFLQHGYRPRRISTHAIERRIQGYSTMADAIGYAYQTEGHLFYVLSFPAGDETWVFDATASSQLGMPIWHQRAYFANGLLSRHRGNCAAVFNNKNIVGDYQNGNMYAFNLDTYLDNGQPIKRVRAWRAVKSREEVQLRFNQLELNAQTGINIPQNLNPLCTLRWSDDSGNTWSNEVQATLGKSGETAWRVMWTRLGQTRKSTGLDRIFEVSTSENIPIAWIGADLAAEPA